MKLKSNDIKTEINFHQSRHSLEKTSQENFVAIFQKFAKRNFFYHHANAHYQHFCSKKSKSVFLFSDKNEKIPKIFNVFKLLSINDFKTWIENKKQLFLTPTTNISTLKEMGYSLLLPSLLNSYTRLFYPNPVSFTA